MYYSAGHSETISGQNQFGGSAMATKEGEKVLGAIVYVRKLMGEVSKMFRAAESLMEKDWEAIDTPAFAFKSGHLDKSEQWVAREAYRFFMRNKTSKSDNPATLCYI